MAVLCALCSAPSCHSTGGLIRIGERAASRIPKPSCRATSAAFSTRRAAVIVETWTCSSRLSSELCPARCPLDRAWPRSCAGGWERLTAPWYGQPGGCGGSASAASGAALGGFVSVTRIRYTVFHNFDERYPLRDGRYRFQARRAGTALAPPLAPGSGGTRSAARLRRRDDQGPDEPCRRRVRNLLPPLPGQGRVAAFTSR